MTTTSVIPGRVTCHGIAEGDDGNEDPESRGKEQFLLKQSRLFNAEYAEGRREKLNFR